MNRDLSRIMAGLGSLALTCAAGAATAGTTPVAETGQRAADRQDIELQEVVVTGTLVRGIAPGGTNIISVDQSVIKETGVATTAQLLQTIPQFGSFGELLRPLGGGNFVTTNRPNLRNLPGFTTNGSSPTLMLIDGHRIVGAGISSTSPDADFVPPGAIARVEIVSDGGSAIYGSDAVAGVVNFITRKDINGVEANVRYGIADSYKTTDGNLSAGTTWNRGGGYITYSYSQNDQILGSDRDFVRTFPANTGLALPITSLECPGGNVNVRLSTAVYGLPYTTATAATKLNQPNQCDLSDYASIYPKQTRHSVFGGLHQQLTDSLEFNTRVFYTNKKSYQSLGLFHETRLLAPQSIPGVVGSPFLSSYFITPGFELQNVSYGYGDKDSQNQRVDLSAWGVVPELTFNFGDGWQARLLGNYGESLTDQHSPILSANTLAAAIPTGLFNPYVPSSSSPATLSAVSNFETFGKSKQKQTDLRLVVDGEIFSMPGGGVKLAVGAEYLKEKLTTQRGQIQPGFQNSGYPATTISGTVGGAARSFVDPARAAIPIFNLSRNVQAAFGEVVFPIFSSQNAKPGLNELTVSISGRHDKYSDFGGTFNPRYGITWKPADWIAFRGAWGKNFSAPSLADDALADPPALSFFSGGTFSFLVPTAVLVANGFPAPTAGNSNGIITLGTKPGLQPQLAKTWSFGFDISPPVIPGLKIGASYYNLNYDGLIGLLPFTVATTYFSEFKSNFIVNPTQAQINAAVAAATIVNGANCSPSPACVYILEDARKQNVGGYIVSGIDFTTNYVKETGFGSIDVSVAGNYELKREQSASKSAAFIDQLAANVGRWRARTSVGTNIGELRAQISWNHRAGYSLNPVIPAAGSFPIQDHVKAFDVIDLFFNYDVKGEGMFKDLSFSLNANNLLDTDPPEFRAQQVTLGTNGFINGNTLGRLVQFGVAKKF